MVEVLDGFGACPCEFEGEREIKHGKEGENLGVWDPTQSPTTNSNIKFKSKSPLYLPNFRSLDITNVKIIP